MGLKKKRKKKKRKKQRKKKRKKKRKKQRKKQRKRKRNPKKKRRKNRKKMTRKPKPKTWMKKILKNLLPKKLKKLSKRLKKECLLMITKLYRTATKKMIHRMITTNDRNIKQLARKQCCCRLPMLTLVRQKLFLKKSLQRKLKMIKKKRKNR